MVDLIVDSQLLDDRFEELRGQVMLLGMICRVLLHELQISHDAIDVSPSREGDSDPILKTRKQLVSTAISRLDALLGDHA